jgi:hypothetical protein
LTQKHPAYFVQADFYILQNLEVLTMLQAPMNPLHEILGSQPVFGHLLAAKTLRNRWKNAEVAGENNSPPPLGAFEIEQMLPAIFTAFVKAQALASNHIGGQNSVAEGALGIEEEMQAEAMGHVEEMDWEIDLG